MNETTRKNEIKKHLSNVIFGRCLLKVISSNLSNYYNYRDNEACNRGIIQSGSKRDRSVCNREQIHFKKCSTYMFITSKQFDLISDENKHYQLISRRYLENFCFSHHRDNNDVNIIIYLIRPNYSQLLLRLLNARSCIK